MAFITYPLNNIDYTAEDAELFHCTRTSGIWAEDSFPISVTGADNNVTIGTGIAWINNEEFSGKVAALKSAEVLDLGIADSVYPRIDVIAIQYSANNNATDVIVKNGTPATNPVRPAIVRTGAIYELYLASIYRPAGATAITASNITDLRMDKTVCGLMADSVTKVDMDAIRAQLMGLVEELEEAIQNIEVGEIVPIEKGGTGANTVAEARQNLTDMGVNPIASSNEDKPENWSALGTGQGYIDSAGKLENQPADKGFIESVIHGNAVIQVFTSWSAGTSGRQWSRVGNQTYGWSSPWKEILTDKTGIQITKLWQNASPTSAFVPQSLAIDFSAYDALLFDFYGSGTFIKMLSDVTGALNVNYMYENTNGTVALGHRFVVADVAGKKTITFNAGRYAQLSGGSSYVTENTILRPLFIYGIKGVQ